MMCLKLRLIYNIFHCSSLNLEIFWALVIYAFMSKTKRIWFLFSVLHEPCINNITIRTKMLIISEVHVLSCVCFVQFIEIWGGLSIKRMKLRFENCNEIKFMKMWPSCRGKNIFLFVTNKTGISLPLIKDKKPCNGLARALLYLQFLKKLTDSNGFLIYWRS